MVWEAIFLLLVLKIPLVYLCWVLWWAIKAEPSPHDGLEGALVTAPLEPGPDVGRPGLRRPFRRRRRPGPHGAPSRTYGRRAALARTRARA